MSRLIVKNLPKVITEENVQKLFSQYGTITDLQLKYSKEGKFREIAFIGYHEKESGEKAIEALNNSFVTTRKIVVEKYYSIGDAAKPKAWSKYAPDSSAFKKAHKSKDKKKDVEEAPPVEKEKFNREEEIAQLLSKYEHDPLFEDFLQVHNTDKLQLLKKYSKKDKGKIDASSEENIEDTKPSPKEKLSEQAISDLEYMKLLMKGGKSEEGKRRQKMEKKPKERIQLFHLKLKNLPYSAGKKEIKIFFDSNKPPSIRVPRQFKGIAYVGYKTEKAYKKALLKDKSFIGSHQIRVMPLEGKELATNKEDDDMKTKKWKNQEASLQHEEDIAESGRIFFRNLSYSTTKKEIEDLFSKHGPIAELSFPIDTSTNASKGFGTVTFVMPEHAVKAYSELDGSILNGRLLHLLPGKDLDVQKDDLEEPTSFKKKKALNTAARAGSWNNWNSLFLSGNAVAQAIAHRLNVSKTDVIGPDEQGSAALRLAIGETQIVTETKKFLEEQGVVLDVFNTEPVLRSKTVMLIKNLPSQTDVGELRDVCQKYGKVSRVILPPNGLTALVEYLEPDKAGKAFKNLAYSKFKSSILLLEWAPEGSVVEIKPQKENSNKKTGDTATKEELKEKIEQGEEEEELEAEPDTTIYVKNLHFGTTSEGLKEHFESCGKVKSAMVATKKDKNNPGATLSMGYGFIQYYLKKSADEALKTLQQSTLDGKSLELQRSERNSKNEVVTTRKAVKLTKQNGTKIMVRNVPFQANRKELFELFGTFGKITTLRLPQKRTNDTTNAHRGFAFVDYENSSNAKDAFDALCQSTHLYGRRLVLEWANPEESVDDLRKRTAEQFEAGVNEPKKARKSVFNVD